MVYQFSSITPTFERKSSKCHSIPTQMPSYSESSIVRNPADKRCTTIHNYNPENLSSQTVVASLDSLYSNSTMNVEIDSNDVKPKLSGIFVVSQDSLDDYTSHDDSQKQESRSTRSAAHDAVQQEENIEGALYDGSRDCIPSTEYIPSLESFYQSHTLERNRSNTLMNIETQKDIILDTKNPLHYIQWIDDLNKYYEFKCHLSNSSHQGLMILKGRVRTKSTNGENLQNNY